ncbi:hypothetical protein GGR33_004895 [Methylobacterium brachythecii]|uniref:Uncharacterized protein n=1 Tax=Methylobacterium brachythecii TaxID=1176177 RepID=A0A7W6F9B9_9HYPH|nr:hypothetical protein [Methylobacterium brachythecii]
MLRRMPSHKRPPVEIQLTEAESIALAYWIPRPLSCTNARSATRGR